MDELKCRTCGHLKSAHLDGFGCMNNHCTCGVDMQALNRLTDAANAHKIERRRERERLGVGRITH